MVASYGAVFNSTEHEHATAEISWHSVPLLRTSLSAGINMPRRSDSPMLNAHRLRDWLRQAGAYYLIGIAS